MNLPAEIAKPKTKKHRVVIDPNNVLPFEVCEHSLQYYDQDEYKYLLHYARAFPDGRIPVVQYLLIRFHPLIIKTCGHYHTALEMEWRDLISFARQKFIELLYRFKLDSSLYFRTYIETALRRAIYDRVLFESRRKLLLKATSLEALHETDAFMQHKELILDAVEPAEDYGDILKKLLRFVETSQELTEEDRTLFRLRFIEGCSLQQAGTKLKLASFYVVTRQRYIRKVLGEYAQKYLL